MAVRLKANQRPDQCAAVRCKTPPSGHTEGVGFLCALHADAAQDGEILGAKPLYPTVAIAEPEVQAPAEAIRGELIELQDELHEALADIKTFEVDAETVNFVRDEVVNVKTQWNELETRRRTITQPLNTALREVNALFRPALTTLSDIEAMWKRKLTDYRLAQEAEQRRLMAEAQKAEAPEEIKTALVQASAAVAPAPAGTSFRDNWLFEVSDPGKLPREYLMVDQAKIRGVVKTLKGDTNIPGVRVWNDPIVAVKAS